MITRSTIVFACHSSACRPPTSGGTGGSSGGKYHALTVAGRHSTGKHPGTIDTRKPDMTGHRLSEAEETSQRIHDILSRTFIGPANKKGRQKMYLATKEEAEAYHKANPPKTQDTRKRVTKYH